MGDKSKIDWTDATWNPIVGCSIVSPACTNCYAMAQAARIERMNEGERKSGLRMREGEWQEVPVSHYAGTTEPSNAGPVWTGKMARAPDHILTRPLRWKRPRKIFVNSMGDLFHESIPDEWIDRVFAVMALAPQHTFQVLTKRVKWMRDYCSDPTTPRRIYELACDLAIEEDADVVLIAPFIDPNHAPPGEKVFLDVWPMKQVWLGVTAEDQARADERIPELLATPAAKRFVSCEPLLGAINLNRIHEQGETQGGAHWQSWESCLNGKRFDEWSDGETDGWPRLDWCITGGESGLNARPSHPDWFRSLRDQCATAAVPFFFKQWGEHLPDDQKSTDCPYGSMLGKEPTGRFADKMAFWRVGRRRAGSLLDGREHKEFPA